MRGDNTARACYSGYILKALADIQDDVKNIRDWNRICPILDEEYKIQIERMYWFIEEMKKKTNDKIMHRYGVLIFPNDDVEDVKKKYDAKVRKIFGESYDYTIRNRDCEDVEKKYEKVRRD